MTCDPDVTLDLKTMHGVYYYQLYLTSTDDLTQLDVQINCIVSASFMITQDETFTVSSLNCASVLFTGFVFILLCFFSTFLLKHL
jgi:hypothetical protein